MLRNVDQKYLESFEMWCWRRMEISLTDRHVGQEYRTYNKNKEGNLDWSHVAYELPSKTQNT